jgi:asparagine synthase (glutamine-hydrolysing)
MAHPSMSVVRDATRASHLMENKEVCSKIRFLLESAIKKRLADGILFSGGLDTSVLAVIAAKHISLKAVTVAFQNAPAPDVEYAVLMAKKLGLEHIIHAFDEGELYDSIPIVVKTRKSFDPMEIRNSVVIQIGLKVAQRNGINAIITGDGCDELFAGYSFLFGLEKEELELRLGKLWSVMSFSSVPLARDLGMRAELPFLDPEFKSFAMGLDSRFLVGVEKGQRFGKWIIRKAFEDFLPYEVTWRVKTPIEYGSGSTILPTFFNQKISDKEFFEKKKKYFAEDKVMIRDKEQLFYYEVYRAEIGVPHPTDLEGKICPQCNSNVAENSTFCRTCGAYPI